MVQTAVQGSIVRLEDGAYRISLPEYGEVIVVPPKDRLPVCRSCHRELTDIEEIALADPFICVRCYTS